MEGKSELDFVMPNFARMPDRPGGSDFGPGAAVADRF
jgi:hypothetical protein